MTSPIRRSPKWKTEAASTASAPASTAGGKSREPAGAAGGDDRDGDVLADGRDHLGVVAVLGAVRVHRVEQDLARAQLGGPVRPLDGVDAGALAAAVRGDLEGCPAAVRAGVDRQHQHLAAEALGDLADQLGAGDGRGVDADLVGARAQQLVDVLGACGRRRRRSAG